MSTLTETFVDLPTSRGDMRVHLFVPQAPGRHPGVIFYSEIFQVTSPIRRMAAPLVHGHIVAVPEVYHEFEPLGTVLAYNQAGLLGATAQKIRKSSLPTMKIPTRRQSSFVPMKAAPVASEATVSVWGDILPFGRAFIPR
jgi:dienelactone hydrolase